MFCKKCGRELNDDARFCPKCGVEAQQPGPQAPLPGYGQYAPSSQPAPPQQPVQSQQPAHPQGRQAPPQYGQYAPPPQYRQHASPPKKKPKKRLFVLAGAAAAVLVFLLVIVPAIGGGKADPGTEDGGLSVDVFVEPPGGREVPFQAGEAGFTTNDPAIKMIEVNQGLSYGFDTDTGEFYVMDSFVAGKETAVFVTLDKKLDPKSEVKLTVEKDGAPVTTLTSVEMVDDHTLLFQPKDMSEAGFWDQGAYTFTFEMDDSVATRTTNFFKSMPMKVLAVPIIGHYSGDIRRCEGDWKQGSTMITALYPVAREEVEYVLGPEQDLSDPKYNLDSKEGRKEVWLALRALQTPNNDYTMIVGFMRTPTKQGYLGYTYGDTATIVCESEPDLLATVVHEIAHCYKVGDEYPNGSLNDSLNPPPYGMEGHDIITREPAKGTKEKVIGGYDYGLQGSGSVIYPEQRAYWPEGRQLLGAVSSIMGEGTGAPSFTFWTSSDIYNHLYEAFTGQMTGKMSSDAGSEQQGEYCGQCNKCFGSVYSPLSMIVCANCAKFVTVTGKEFSCDECGAKYNIGDFSEKDMWIYHPDCDSILYYPEFAAYNRGSGSGKSASEQAMALEIIGDIDESGAFSPNPWYAYEVMPSTLTSKMSGEYSASVYDGSGKRLSIACFNTFDDTQVSTKEGAASIEDTNIPIRVVVKLPDNAAKVVIQKGDKEIYTKELSANTPEVAFKGLKEGQKLTNNETLSWEASDADGDELTFQIWYCRGEDEEYLVASNITGRSLDVDLTDYPGSDASWFRILASDGARTGMAESPKVDVPFRAPDILNNIPEGKQFKVTEMVEIQGKVYDAQDGWLWNEGYEWRVDGMRFNNYGNFYFWHPPYMLSPGMHTITLKATNSAGVSSSKDFVIEILEDESDLPSDWSRNDITLALRLGYYLPLHRLDAPVTRLEFAKMMFSVYSLVLPDDFKQLPFFWSPEFSDMSNEMNDMDYYYASSMVGMGLMEARDGKFNPYGSITEREAMQVIYKTLELSKTQTLTEYEVMDESEFIPSLIEWGVLDVSGERDVYQPNVKLTNKLTMVRIARLVRYEEDLEEKDYGVAAGFFNNYYEED